MAASVSYWSRDMPGEITLHWFLASVLIDGANMKLLPPNQVINF